MEMTKAVRACAMRVEDAQSALIFLLAKGRTTGPDVEFAKTELERSKERLAKLQEVAQ